MNGIHDMGGMHGMGPIHPEEIEPVFHADWEKRVYAIVRAIRPRSGTWNIDAGRHEIELFPADEYLRMSYYEKWAKRLPIQLMKTGLATETEVASGTPAPGSTKGTSPLTAEMVPAMLAARGSKRRDVRVRARFRRDQRVRPRNINPIGHTRLARYVRGRIGVVMEDRGVWVFPDTNAHFLGEKPQHLYSVRFAARELWGEQASPRDFVYLDLWDDYLERA